ncbi:MAG: YggT family protein [Treponema sp.]|jgi:YggT family protein|nr:YggT family protein [Treponema sp.]
MFFKIFSLISSLIGLYSFLCLIRIFLTWIPEAQFSKPGQILSQITDPYLNIFRKIKVLRFRNIDFSPIVALAVLSLASSISSSIAMAKRIHIGGIFATIVGMAWSLVQSLGTVLIVIMIIRLVAIFLGKNNSSIWYSIDTTLRPITTLVANIFFKNKPVSWRDLMLVTTISMIIVMFACGFIVHLLVLFLSNLPI